MLGRNICRKTSLFHQIRHSGIWKIMPTYCCNEHLTTDVAKMNSVNDPKCMQWFHIGNMPRCSMYGIFTYIWLKFIVNVGIYIYIPYMEQTGYGITKSRSALQFGAIFTHTSKRIFLVSLKLAVCPWKQMVGRWNLVSGWPIFRGKLAVGFSGWKKTCSPTGGSMVISHGRIRQKITRNKSPRITPQPPLAEVECSLSQAFGRFKSAVFHGLNIIFWEPRFEATSQDANKRSRVEDITL